MGKHEDLKKCPKCGKEKARTEFWKDLRYKDGLMCHCKECRNLCKKTRRKDPEYREKENAKRRATRGPARWSNLKAKYGLSLDCYDELLRNQNGCCKICLKTENAIGEHLYVDHCHTTGKVRGLLCSHCNTGLGMFLDDTLLLKKAILYLDEARD